MANPNLPTGPLNLLLTSITIPGTPALNVTPPFLGKQMVRFSPEGEMSRALPVAVSIVQSPQLYVIATVTVDLVKSMSLAAAWKSQWESNTYLGDVTVRPDTSVFPPFDLSEVAIADVREMSFNGEEPDVFVTLRGQYPINADLWP